ncbi:MAG: UDP-N-acetylmuramate--L-alanine ligase [Parcubacteria group bacterium]|nr:UDP-N-acetylmuramate--L-alanine ligase [Parcubacteria group bacterium]
MKIDLSILSKAQNIHFIGIGGIGISAIARMMLKEGKKVSGSDMSESEITKELEREGATIYKSHVKGNVNVAIDIVIYTIAISDDNPELLEARSLGISALSYPQALGLISKEKYTIAVSGTHGKTTTTAMIAEVMVQAGLDPTVIVGSLMSSSSKQRSNLIVGKSKYLVAEACEFRRSFLNLNPNILIITNIDNDHLDYYKNLADIKSAFRELVEKLSVEDYLICNLSQKNIKPVIKGLKCNVVDYSSHINQNLKLKIPGKHNRENAGAVLALAEILSIPKENVIASLSDFRGTWRRFEFRGESRAGVSLYDDYAHHPTEIKASLSGAREMFPNKKITVIFQPHLYSRTKLLLSDFGKSFKDVDCVCILPIYAAREKLDPSIDSAMLVKEIVKNNSKAIMCDSINDASQYIKMHMLSGEVLITMGAGDVYKIIDSILK